MGPSNESQREEADEFLDKIVQNMQVLPPPGTPQAKILALAVKARDIGVYGDQIAEILDPPPQPGVNPAQLAQQLQGQLQQAELVLKQQHEIISKDLIKSQTELQKTSMVEKNKVNLAILDRQSKILVAQIETKAQDVQARREETNEVWTELHQAAHETAMQNDQQAHEQDLAQQQAQNSQVQQATQIQADQQSQDSQAQGAQ